MTLDEVPESDPTIMEITQEQIDCVHRWVGDDSDGIDGEDICVKCKIRLEDWAAFNEAKI